MKSPKAKDAKSVQPARAIEKIFWPRGYILNEKPQGQNEERKNFFKRSAGANKQ
jgi:hypothetical protein